MDWEVAILYWLAFPPNWFIHGAIFWEMLTWIVFPATWIAAAIIALRRGLRPNGRALGRAVLATTILLVFCLIPRLYVAPMSRPYPPASFVLLRFMQYSALGLTIAVAAFGIGWAIRALSAARGGKAP